MRRFKVSGLLCLLLCICMAFAACGKKDAKENATKTPAKQVTEAAAPSTEPTGAVTPTPEIPVSFDFSSVDSEISRMIKEAVEQYENEDYTPLAEPVKYYVLWIGFTHATFGDLDFQMTAFDREYLEAVTLNYEKTVESIANHNVDITVYLHFVDDAVPLTQYPGEDWLYLDKKHAFAAAVRFRHDPAGGIGHRQRAPEPAGAGNLEFHQL